MRKAWTNEERAQRLATELERDGFEDEDLEPGYVAWLLRELAAKCADLTSRLESAERMRPQWAKGYTSDSVAAQTSSAALQQVWSLLGVDNQTQCMQALKRLIEVNKLES